MRISIYGPGITKSEATGLPFQKTLFLSFKEMYDEGTEAEVLKTFGREAGVSILKAAYEKRKWLLNARAEFLKYQASMNGLEWIRWPSKNQSEYKRLEELLYMQTEQVGEHQFTITGVL